MLSGVFPNENTNVREFRKSGKSGKFGKGVTQVSYIPEVRVLTSGDVSAAEAELADRSVREVLTRAGAPVRLATVTLTVVDDPDLPRPALAQATVEHGTRTFRAQAAAPSALEAVQLLQTRLSWRLAG